MDLFNYLNVSEREEKVQYAATGRNPKFFST